MAKRTQTGSTRARARTVAREGEAIRDRVHDLTVRAFRDRNLSLRELPGLVDEVLEGAAEGVRESVPEARTSVLRQVFDGLSDGVDAITSAGSGVAGDAVRRGRTLVDRDMPAAGRQMKAANEDFLEAVSNFAGRLSHELRAELDGLVSRARRAGPRVKASAQEAMSAADGRLLELTRETARAGADSARRAAGGLVMAAGGLMEGLADAIAPRQRTAAARPASKKSRPKAAAKKVKKKATKAKAKKKKAAR